jgi:acyl-CoA synthetase (AMP-forming)/AMP-acid ligase II
MKMPQRHSKSLRDVLTDDSSGRFLWAAGASVALGDLARGTSLGVDPAELEGRSVVVATSDQLTTALALIELDGVARRLILCPPDLSSEQLSQVIATAQADAMVLSPDGTRSVGCQLPLRVTCKATIAPTRKPPCRAHLDGTDTALAATRQTEWIMLTSGTTGAPKMVVHTLSSLTAAIKPVADQKAPVVWGTFYDIRRYGGLQIFLRAVLGGTSLVLSSAGEPMGDHLARLALHGVTHMTGTPSHWRWALLNPSARAISPQYVRLSGEIADQAILDSLREFYPSAAIGHAYASTEAGVGFEVNDGLEGFPAGMIGSGRVPIGSNRRRALASLVGRIFYGKPASTFPENAPKDGAVEMKVVDGSLRIRSVRTADHYLGRDASAGEGSALLDADGFVDTGDIVELRAGRYYFIGRRGGIINVGGLKVHPEEIEAVINRHPDVRMSLVRSRKNPITGAIVVADVVLRTEPAGGNDRAAELKREILQVCRNSLAQHKVPAAIRFVPSLDVAANGKIARHHA